MNLHQFRFVQEAVRRELNLTETAKALFTSQPGVSKAILELEAELGVDIFARHGKRLRRVTEPGRQVLKSIETIMREVGNLKRIGEEFSQQDAGTLVDRDDAQPGTLLPAGTHSPVPQEVSRRSASACTRVRRNRSRRMVLEEVAEIGLATESLNGFDELVTLPCYEWHHAVVMPSGHPLTALERLSLEDLAIYPLVSYHPSFSGRTRVDQAFAARQLKPDIVLEAIDADVIKTYVKLGLGIGIVAEMAARDEPAAANWSGVRSAICSARTSRGWRSSAARTCATSSMPSPRRLRSG
jgi:LysR family cys regulon transcriptional activator